MGMKYKFRFVFFYAKPGFFRIDEEFISYSLNENLVIQIFPRDSDTLIGASKYHIDCGGFSSKEEAKNCGEKLRTHLRMLNCILDLGLLIPSIDGTSGSVSEEIKNKIREDGAELLDTIVGLHVYPDDEKYIEHVFSGKINAFPSDPFYVLKGLKDSWPSTFELNESTAEVLEILNISVREGSPKVKFLATYLAIEQLIKRKMRSESAQELIDQFIEITNRSTLSEAEKSSLSGSLGHLKEQSFSSAFSAFSKRITSPKTINGKPITKFVSDCIDLRNKIAHKVAITSSLDIDEYTKHLRQMVMSILWTENNFPDFSIYRPADQFEMEKMEIRMM
ncbi:Apea-like HEPN domain-containing protein [Tumidithrix helvetica PCC 7403]|uniref:hypothetical protein n=1 Tax=Tumidithrix helvetica TaxID=3457545 RepID=UPI003C8A7272